MAKKATGAAKVTLNDYVKKTSIGGGKLKKSSMNKHKKRQKGLNNGGK